MTFTYTYETEYNFFKLVFLDVMLCRDGENIATTVSLKVTNADAYFNWNLFAPHSWKRETLKTCTQRAFMMFSTTELLDTELKHFREGFSLEKQLSGMNDLANFRTSQIY